MAPENGENHSSNWGTSGGDPGEPSPYTYKDISQCSWLERQFGWLYKPNVIYVGQTQFDSDKRKKKLSRK